MTAQRILLILFLILLRHLSHAVEEGVFDLSSQLRICTQNLNNSDTHLLAVRTADNLTGNSCSGLRAKATLQRIAQETENLRRSAQLSGRSVLEESNIRLQKMMHAQSLRNTVKTFATNSYLFRGGASATMLCKTDSKQAWLAIDCLMQEMCGSTAEDSDNRCSKEIRKDVELTYQQTMRELKKAGVLPIKKENAVAVINAQVRELNKKLAAIAPPDFHDDAVDPETMKGGRHKYTDAPSKDASQKMQEYREAYAEVTSQVPGTFLLANTWDKKLGRRSFEDVQALGESGNWTAKTTKHQMQPHQEVTSDEFEDAYKSMDAEIMAQAKSLNEMELRRKQSPSDAKVIQHQLSRLIKTNPTALAQILSAKPELVVSACNSFEDIHRTEKWDRIFDHVWTWGSLVVGGVAVIASGGAATPAVAAIAALDAGKSAHATYESYKEQQAIRRAIVTGGGDDRSLDDYAKARSDTISNALGTGVAVAFAGLELKALSKATTEIARAGENAIAKRAVVESSTIPLENSPAKKIAAAKKAEAEAEKDVHTIVARDPLAPPTPRAERMRPRESAVSTTKPAKSDVAATRPSRKGKVYTLVERRKEYLPDVLPDGTTVDYLSLGKSGNVEQINTPKALQRDARVQNFNAADSTSVVLKLTSPRGQKKIFKPFGGEHAGVQAWFSGAQKASLGHREVLVSEIADALGAEGFMKARFRDVKHPSPVVGGMGAEIEHFEGKTLREMGIEGSNLLNNPEFNRKAADIRLIDFLVGNHDRINKSNWMVAKNAKGELIVRGIDNGKSFTNIVSVNAYEKDFLRDVDHFRRETSRACDSMVSRLKKETVAEFEKRISGIKAEVNYMIDSLPVQARSEVIQKLSAKSSDEWYKMLQEANRRYARMHPDVKEPLLTHFDMMGFLNRRELILKSYSEKGVLKGAEAQAAALNAVQKDIDTIPKTKPRGPVGEQLPEVRK